MTLTTHAALSKRFLARYPDSGVVGSISASEGTGKLPSVEAAGFRPFSAVGGVKVLKATEHFYVAGEVVAAGNLVEVSDRDAANIIALGRAVEATPAEIASAKVSD